MKPIRRILAAIMLFAGLSSTSHAQPIPVYWNDFEDPSDNLSEWTPHPTEMAPSGERFLGQFGSGTKSLLLQDLPAHTAANVTLDLYVIRTWDGNDSPDLWEFATDGVTRLHTSFSNVPQYRQAYPNWYPGGDNFYRTGQDGINTLGYLWEGNPMDTTYNMDFDFSHTAGTLRLDFSGFPNELPHNESWGIDNIHVSVVPEPDTAVLLLAGALGYVRRRKF